MFNSIVVLGTIFLLVSNVCSDLDSDNTYIPSKIDFLRQHDLPDLKRASPLIIPNYNTYIPPPKKDVLSHHRFSGRKPTSSIKKYPNQDVYAPPPKIDILRQPDLSYNNLPSSLNPIYPQYNKYSGGWLAVDPMNIPYRGFLSENADRYQQVLQDTSPSSSRDDLSIIKQPPLSLDSVFDPSKLNPKSIEYPLGWSNIKRNLDNYFINQADKANKDQQPIQIWPSPQRSKDSNQLPFAFTINFIDSDSPTKNENKPKSPGFTSNSFWNSFYNQLGDMVQSPNVNQNEPSNTPKPIEISTDRWITKLQPSLIEIEDSSKIPSSHFESTSPISDQLDLGKLILKTFKYFLNDDNSETMHQPRSTNTQNLPQDSPEGPLTVFSSPLININDNGAIPTFSIELDETRHKTIRFDDEKDPYAFNRALDNSEYVRTNTLTDNKSNNAKQRAQTNNNRKTARHSNKNNDSHDNKADSNSDSDSEIDERNLDIPEKNVGNKDSQTQLDQNNDENKLTPPVETNNDENVSNKRHAHNRQHILGNWFRKHNQQHDHHKKHQKHQNDSSKNVQSDQANQTDQKSSDTEAHDYTAVKSNNDEEKTDTS